MKGSNRFVGNERHLRHSNFLLFFFGPLKADSFRVPDVFCFSFFFSETFFCFVCVCVFQLEVAGVDAGGDAGGGVAWSRRHSAGLGPPLAGPF